MYRKVVSVPAENEHEAQRRAWDAWRNTEVIFDMFENFQGAEAYVLDDDKYTTEPDKNYQLIENPDYENSKSKG